MQQLASMWSNVGCRGVFIGTLAYATFAMNDFQGACLLFGTATVTELVGISALKKLINTKRPNGEDHSFPSGHSTTVTLVPCFLALRYNLPVTAPAVSGSIAIAASVVAARLLSKAHWPIDVAGGVAIGGLVSRAVFSLRS